jgi:hypothetical protein
MEDLDDDQLEGVQPDLSDDEVDEETEPSA